MKKILISTALFLSPAIAFAATLDSVLRIFGDLINQATPIVVALALLYFFWGLAKYILATGDPESKASGLNMMIWGIIALFVMVAVWGLVQVLVQTFNVQAGGGTKVPFVR